MCQAIIGREQGWLNPFHPEVQQFLIEMIAEVVRGYSVAGIQLDDHFALPIEYGYDSYTLKLYQDEHSGQLPGNSNDPKWMRWRADRLTELMTQIHKAVKLIRSDAIVSLSPNAADYAYRKSLQDWPRWVEMGLIDEVVVQLYRPSLASLQVELNDAKLKTIAQTVPLSVGLYTGPFNGAKAKKRIDQEVAAVPGAIVDVSSKIRLLNYTRSSIVRLPRKSVNLDRSEIIASPFLRPPILLSPVSPLDFGGTIELRSPTSLHSSLNTRNAGLTEAMRSVTLLM